MPGIHRHIFGETVLGGKHLDIVYQLNIFVAMALFLYQNGKIINKLNKIRICSKTILEKKTNPQFQYLSSAKKYLCCDVNKKYDIENER